MGNVQILLRQHVGAPCAAIVKAGDEVKKGTKIATPTGLGANIFSSVYGVVGVDQYIAVFQFEICRKLRIDLRIQLRRLRLRQINARLNPRRESGSCEP